MVVEGEAEIVQGVGIIGSKNDSLAESHGRFGQLALLPEQEAKIVEDLGLAGGEGAQGKNGPVSRFGLGQASALVKADGFGEQGDRILGPRQ